jgi:hypothetical protein
LVNRSENDAAFAILNALKAQRVRVQGNDYSRALCFVVRKESLAAIEALKEDFAISREISKPAKWWQICRREREPVQMDDAEFLQILEVIRPCTNLGEGRLLSLFRSAKRLCDEDLPGNFVECGVAAGGSSALLTAVIAGHSKRPRKLFSFDTFEGMPEPSPLVEKILQNLTRRVIPVAVQV